MHNTESDACSTDSAELEFLISDGSCALVAKLEKLENEMKNLAEQLLDSQNQNSNLIEKLRELEIHNSTLKSQIDTMKLSKKIEQSWGHSSTTLSEERKNVNDSQISLKEIAQNNSRTSLKPSEENISRASLKASELSVVKTFRSRKSSSESSSVETTHGKKSSENTSVIQQTHEQPSEDDNHELKEIGSQLQVSGQNQVDLSSDDSRSRNLSSTSLKSVINIF